MATVKKALAVLNDSIEIDIPSDKLSITGLQLIAGFVGQVVLEGTILGGSDYFVIALNPSGGGAAVLITPTPAVAGANGWWAETRGYEKVRARVSVAGAGGMVGLTNNISGI